MLTKQGLMIVKTKAVKKRVWYETLSRAERAIVDLTIKCVEKVRSPTLAKAITKIIGKINQTLQHGFLEKAFEIGSDVAKQVASIAQKWGNTKSSNWADDTNFIIFLGVTALNT